jgi:hypothetical protein
MIYALMYFGTVAWAGCSLYFLMLLIARIRWNLRHTASGILISYALIVVAVWIAIAPFIMLSYYDGSLL